jgi:hypothetical protein
MHNCMNKLGNDSSILGVGVLPGTEYIEISECGGLKTIEVPEDFAVNILL